MFMLSFFEVSNGALKKIEYYRFFWQNDQHKKKYMLVRWLVLCKTKEQGGLGIQKLDVQNKCLLSKWLFNLYNEQGDILRNKYVKDRTLSQVVRT